MATFLRSIWLEPEPAQPRGASARLARKIDVALACLLSALAIVEAMFRDDVSARPSAIASALAIIALIAWRRSHPFGAFCGAFAIAIGLNVASFLSGVASQGLWVNAAILLLPYSLFRWGSGRHAVIGLFILALVYVSSAWAGEMKDASATIGSAVVLLLPAAIGAAVRFRASARAREVDAARATERERIARDLHDTVAHHVSAIAIQAQAGRLVVKTRPEAAERALAAIEGEASRALTELRSLVGILRNSDGPSDAPLVPQPCIADIDALARTLPDGRIVDVELHGDLGGLPASLQTAAFRIAQEGVTNAVRHAHQATRVSVRVYGEPSGVRVTVGDDGRAPSQSAGGYGLAGMAERAAQLGGKLSAGPGETGGWRVEAFLPRHSSSEAS